jgi:hypothetical protein
MAVGTPAYSGSVENEKVETGAAATGAAENNAAETGAAETEAAENHVAETGAAENHVAETGAAENGAAENNAAAQNQGAATMSECWNNPEQSLQRQAEIYLFNGKLFYISFISLFNIFFQTSI